MAHYQSILYLSSALLPQDLQEAAHKHQFVVGRQAAAGGSHTQRPPGAPAGELYLQGLIREDLCQDL